MQSLKKILCKKSPSKTHLKTEEPSEKDPLLRSEKQSYSTISYSDPLEEEPEPSTGGPDGIRSWIVAFAIFLVSMLMSGQARVGSILFMDFMSFFHVGRKIASAPYTAKQSTKNLVGPIAGILGQKYGVRAVVITGGILSALSSASCYFVNDITFITVMWGVVGGMANGFTSSINQVVIEKYFKVFRTSASGLAFSGACVGAIFFSSFVEKLIEQYGLNGAFLILGSITTFVVPAAMILVDPPWFEKPVIVRTHSENEAKKRRESKNASSSVDENSEEAFRLSDNGATFDKVEDNLSSSKEINCNNEENENISPIDFQYLQQNGDMVYQLLTYDAEMLQRSVNALSESDQNSERIVLLRELDYMCHCLQQPQNEALNYIADIKRSIETFRHQNKHANFNLKYIIVSQLLSSSEDTRIVYNVIPNNETASNCSWQVSKELFFTIKLLEFNDQNASLFFVSLDYSNISRATKVLNELKKLRQLFTGNDSSQTLTHKNSYANVLQDHKSEDNDHPNTIFNHIKTSIKLHSNPLFLLVCLCRGLYMLTFTPVLTAGVDFAIDKGLKRNDGIYVVGVLSIGDLIGRLCSGWITDRKFISLERYFLFAMIIQGILTVSLPFCHGGVVLPAMIFFAMVQGSLFVRHPVAVAKYLRPHEKSIGIGFINLPAGVLGFLLPSYIGYFRDKLGSYDQMFYINGSLTAMAGLLWTLEPWLLRYVPANKELNKENL